MKNFFKNKKIKRTFLGVLITALMLGGIFINQAFAEPGSPVTPATGGSAISIDTTSDGDCAGTPCEDWTTISGLKITESAAGDIATGAHVLTLPAGWEFDTTQPITLASNGNLIVASPQFPTQTTFTFNVTTISSGTPNTLTFITEFRVRPTGKTPATGNITMTSGTIAGVDGSTNFGTLTSIAGTVTKLAITTEPTDTVYGSAISSTVVKTQDQFGNNSVVGLATSEIINVSKQAGDGALSGTVFKDIGTSVGNGTATFDDLKFNQVGAHQLTTGNSANYANVNSASFNITAKPLTISGLSATSKTYDKTTDAALTGTTALVGVVDEDLVSLDGTATGTFDTKNYGTGKTVTVSGLSLTGAAAGNYSLTALTLTADINKVALTVAGAVSVSKEYDGDTTATADFTGASLTGVLAEETVGLVSTGYGATFDNKNVGTGKTVTISGLTLDGADAGNYSLTQPSLTDGAITQAAITVTADSSQTKVYGASDPTLAYTVTSGSLIGGDTFAGALARATGEDVGTTYAINQGNLANGNYLITFVPANFAITAKPITVTADSSQTKVYGATDPALTYAVTSGSLIDGDAFTGALARATGEDVASDYAINQGTLANTNYNITFVPANFAITAKELTVINAVVTSKTYNRDTDATITGATLSGVVGTEDVTLGNATTGTFASKDVANGISVTTTPMTISGTDIGNYTLTQPTLTGNIIPLQLTIDTPLSITMNKVYDQTTTAAVTPNTLIGVISGDTVGVTAAANYASPTVGTVKAITIVYSLTDADAGNYTKPADAYTGANGSITPIQLTITDPTVTTSKTYDGTTTAVVTVGVLSGVLPDDDVAANAVSSYATKTVEAIKTITTVYSLTGTKAENYVAPINFSTVDGAIVAKELTVTGSAVTSRVYNGGADAAITGATLSGAIEGDTVTLGDATTGTFASSDVANGISVATLPMTISGADAGNYSLTQPTLTGNITKATPVITWNNPADIAAGTALSGTQLNATATGVAGALAGTFVYDPSASYATNTVGVLALDTTFTPTDTTNYNNQTASVEVNIVPAAIAKLTISADSSNLVANENSTITVTGYDQYDNVVTNNSSAVISLSTDNGGSLASALLTLASGVKTTTLSKNSAGVVNVNATSGILAPATTPVTFTAVPTDTQAPTISAISTSTTQTTADIIFQSNENGRGKVSYSKSGVTPIDTSYISLTAATPATINLAGLTCGTTYNYTINIEDGSANLTTSDAATFATASCTEPTEISSSANIVKRIATKNGLHADGWKWILDVTVPTASTTLQMSFDNLTGAGTILAHDNIRFYSAQFTGHTSTSTAISVVTPGAGTAWSDAITLTGDISSNPGRQIQIIVEAAVPSATVDGYYSASYDLKASQPED